MPKRSELEKILKQYNESWYTCQNQHRQFLTNSSIYGAVAVIFSTATLALLGGLIYELITGLSLANSIFLSVTISLVFILCLLSIQEMDFSDYYANARRKLLQEINVDINNLQADINNINATKALIKELKAIKPQKQRGKKTRIRKRWRIPHIVCLCGCDVYARYENEKWYCNKCGRSIDKATS